MSSSASSGMNKTHPASHRGTKIRSESVYKFNGPAAGLVALSASNNSQRTSSMGQLNLFSLSDPVAESNCPTSGDLFQTALKARQGSVLSRGTILKRDHYPQGTNYELEYCFEGAPNFRKTHFNIYGVSQPTKSGLVTLLHFLNYVENRRVYWFNSREEPVIYINGYPFVLRDADFPKQNVRTYTGITADRLEQLEQRLKDDILKESKKCQKLLLVHDELDDGSIISSWICADTIETSKDVFHSLISSGFDIVFTRIPISPEQRPEDKYLDEYVQIVKNAPLDAPLVFNCGLGVGRTTFGMVSSLLIRNAMMIHQGIKKVEEPFLSPADSEIFDMEQEKRTVLRLVYVIERGLNSKFNGVSAIEWALSRGNLTDHLKNALCGNYSIIISLASVLENGQHDKKLLDQMINRCDTLINLREEILINRIRFSSEDNPHYLDKAQAFLERYLFLLAFSAYVNIEITNNYQDLTFSQWLLKRPEVWNMLQSVRKKGTDLFLFRPVEDLSGMIGKTMQETFGKNKRKELDGVVIRNRNGVVLGPQLILKVDHWPSEKMLKGEIEGAANFRRIADLKLFAVAQPTLDGITNVINYVSKVCEPKKIVWINLREEPLVYINKSAYVLRDEFYTLRNLKSYAGITQNRLDSLECRLKEDVIKEAHQYEGKILLHEESEGEVYPLWTVVEPQDVFTIKETFDEFSTKNNVSYCRVPITAETCPEEKDFDQLLYICLQNDENSAVFIINCQIGIGRSTTGAVILSLILKWLKKYRKSEKSLLKVNSDHSIENKYLTPADSSAGSYQAIHSLLRVIRSGLDSKHTVDTTIDECATFINLRSTIDDWRSKAENAVSVEEKEAAVKKGLASLGRYFYLIAFQAFLETSRPESLYNMESFSDFVKKHAEFKTMLKDMEAGGFNSLLPVHKIEPGDGVALSSEVLSVVNRRKGSVLASQMILKYDHFPGCQKLSLLDRIEGAPNFRQVEPYPGGGKIFGVAMPTKDAIISVVQKTGVRPGENKKLIWTSLREEPVIYINGRPFVLRFFQDPVKNLETTGIIQERVELMEKRMKKDIIEEMKEYGGRILLHEEEVSSSGFQVVPVWESCTPENVLTPSEVFEALHAQGFNVLYRRIPITDEQAPIPHVFDLVLQEVEQMGPEIFLMFNCQMGRGRTTTGMVIAYLSQLLREKGATKSVLTPSNDDDSLLVKSVNSLTLGEQERERERYLHGEYKVILQLISVLQFGTLSKRIVDEAIDGCYHIQNIREAVYDYKIRIQSIEAVDSNADNKKKLMLFHVGINYLIRYFYLITFGNYLLEKSNQTGSFPSFNDWLSDRREISNLISGEIDFS